MQIGNTLLVQTTNKDFCVTPTKKQRINEVNNSARFLLSTTILPSDNWSLGKYVKKMSVHSILWTFGEGDRVSNKIIQLKNNKSLKGLAVDWIFEH